MRSHTGRTEHGTDTWAFNPRAINEKSLERGVDEDGEAPPDFSNRGKQLPVPGLKGKGRK